MSVSRNVTLATVIRKDWTAAGRDPCGCNNLEMQLGGLMGQRQYKGRRKTWKSFLRWTQEETHWCPSLREAAVVLVDHRPGC